MRYIKRYIWNLLISIDQFANTLLGGDPDETLSSRLGKYQHRCPVCRFICRLLSKIDYRHCQKSIEDDEGDREVIKL